MTIFLTKLAIMAFKEFDELLSSFPGDSCYSKQSHDEMCDTMLPRDPRSGSVRGCGEDPSST